MDTIALIHLIVGSERAWECPIGTGYLIGYLVIVLAECVIPLGDDGRLGGTTSLSDGLLDRLECVEIFIEIGLEVAEIVTVVAILFG